VRLYKAKCPSICFLFKRCPRNKSCEPSTSDGKTLRCGADVFGREDVHCLGSSMWAHMDYLPLAGCS